MRGMLAGLLSVLLSVGIAAAQPREAVDVRLAELSQELVRARFSVTGPAVTELLGRDDLTARQRNQALEILAVTQIALGEPEAEETLRVLYGRDPEHRLGNAGLGPAIEAAFARARESADRDADVSLSAARIEEDRGGGSPFVIVAVERGAGAIEQLVLSYRDAAAGPYASLTMPLRDAEARARLPVLGGGELAYYVEARAPSGATLARVGSAAEPLVAELPRPPSRVATFVIDGSAEGAERDDGGSIFGEWWLWTAVGVVVVGAIAGWFLLGPPSDDAPSGSLGRGALE